MLKKTDKSFLLLALMLVLALFLIAAFWYTFNDAQRHDRNKTELIALSNNVLHDNNELIRRIRTYVLSRQEIYRDEYLELLNDPGSFYHRLERMQEIGLTDFELVLVEQIISTWDRLEQIEDNVLGHMADGDFDRAVAVVSSNEYLEADDVLQYTIHELITDIEERSSETTRKINIRLVVIMVVFSAAFLGIAVILSVIFSNNLKLRDLYKKQKEDYEHEATMLQYIFDSLPIAVRIADSGDLTLMYANKEILELFGYDSYEEVMSHTVIDFLTPVQPDGKKIEEIHKEANAKDATVIDVQCQKKDGQVFMARVTSCKIDYKGRPASLATIEDITAQQEYMQKLENIAAQEHEANQLKSRFLATMSHEVRTPMNAILGITEILMQNEAITHETKEAVSRIFDSGNLLLNIINDILDLSKIEAGKLDLIPVKYDIPSLINDTVQLANMRFESSPVDFQLYINPKTPVNLYGDELRIRQVLNNILSNAFKYTQMGRVTLSVSVDENTATRAAGNTDGEENDVTIIFVISDTGQGIAPEQLSKLFDEYTRFNLESNRTTAGTGLGMSITKRLVDLMNGKISVVSEVGSGSIFTVRIPQKRVDDLVCGSNMSEKLQEHSFKQSRLVHKSSFIREYMPYGTVLVVDDMETNLYVTRGMLLPYGMKVDTVNSGFDAINKITAGCNYDIIFMDHMMPIMDGMQTVAKLREMGYNGCIVALTANALIGQAEVFLKNGFDGYISKPIDSRELNTVLNEQIRNKKPASVVKKARREQAAMLADSHIRQRSTPPRAADGDEPSQLNIHFISDTKKTVKTLKGISRKHDEISADDLNTLEVTIHGLKTPLRSIGEKLLAERAGELESIAHLQDTGTLVKELPLFIKQLEAVIKNMRFGS